MTARERIIKMFGSIDKVPAYLIRALGIREASRKRSADRVKEAEAEKERKRERIKSLRRPPSKVWRVGTTIFWLPPETADELEPDGYWISELRKGSWTKHGDYLRPDFRSAQLFGNNPARVEAYYHGTALGEVYMSPTVHPSADEDPYLVNRVRYYISEGRRPPVYYERWRRVLCAFGVAKGKFVRGKHITPLAPPMTAAEARGYADRGWRRWEPVALVLEKLEKEHIA